MHPKNKQFHHIKQNARSSLCNNWDPKPRICTDLYVWNMKMHHKVILFKKTQEGNRLTSKTKLNTYYCLKVWNFPKMSLDQTRKTKWKNNSKEIFLDNTKIPFR